MLHSLIEHKPRVLLVDDDPTMALILEASSIMKDFNINSFQDGFKALEEIDMISPDLIILDNDMPGITGIELCVSIKEIPRFAEIPVIFLTGMEETRQMISAFNAGAVDYIIKPVNLDELSIRAKTHLSLFFARKKIAEFAGEMERLAENRAKQLVHADRLATLGTLSAGLAHEIKNPATFISGNIQTLEKFWPVIEETLNSSVSEASEKEKLMFIINEMPGLIAGIKDGVSRIRKVTDGLKSFARKDQGEKKVFIIQNSINAVLSMCDELLKGKVKVIKDLPEKQISIKGDSQQIEQVFINLITNAAQAMDKVENACLEIKISELSGKVKISFSDNGPGIKDTDKIEDLWEPFFTTKPAGKGTGLGLPICRFIIDAHNGSIEAFPNTSGGLTFNIELPAGSGEKGG